MAGTGVAFAKADVARLANLVEKLNNSEARVLAWLLRRVSWEDNRVSASRAEIARELGCSTDTAWRAVRLLSGRGVRRGERESSRAARESDGCARRKRRDGTALVTAPFLAEVSRGTYMVNPAYLYVGGSAKCERLLAEFARASNRAEARRRGLGKKGD